MRGVSHDSQKAYGQIPYVGLASTVRFWGDAGSWSASAALFVARGACLNGNSVRMRGSLGPLRFPAGVRLLALASGVLSPAQVRHGHLELPTVLP